MELSIKLDSSMFFTPPQPEIKYIPNLEINIDTFQTQALYIDARSFFPDIQLERVESIGTPESSETSTLKVLSIYRDQLISGVRIKSTLLVQLSYVLEGVLAETWLEGVYEYGVGDTDNKAIEDLIISLKEYLCVLMKDKESLGNSALKDFESLSKVIEFDAAGGC
jgi:hypothetical protein